MGMAALSLSAPLQMEGAVERPAVELKGRSSFTMWQIPSHADTIGHSYVFRTHRGRLIVID